jgi:hypothetical protein
MSYTCSAPTGPFDINGNSVSSPRAGITYYFKFSISCSNGTERITGYYSFSDSVNWFAAQTVTGSGMMTVSKSFSSAGSWSMTSYLNDNTTSQVVVNPGGTLSFSILPPSYTCGTPTGPFDINGNFIGNPKAGVAYSFKFPISCSLGTEQITGYYSFSDSVNWFAAQTVTGSGTMTVSKLFSSAGSWSMTSYLYDNTTSQVVVNPGGTLSFSVITAPPPPVVNIYSITRNVNGQLVATIGGIDYPVVQDISTGQLFVTYS